MMYSILPICVCFVGFCSHDMRVYVSKINAPKDRKKVNVIDGLSHSCSDRRASTKSSNASRWVLRRDARARAHMYEDIIVDAMSCSDTRQRSRHS